MPPGIATALPLDPFPLAPSPHVEQAPSPRRRPSKPPRRTPEPQSLQSEHPTAPPVSHPLSTLNETQPVVAIAAKIKAVENNIERMFDSSIDFVGHMRRPESTTF
jgi:hypothetical protein